MPPAKIKSGKILYKNQDITEYSHKKMRGLRGKEFSMIFQDPMTSLNPTMKVGRQITEGILSHDKIGMTNAIERAVEMLKMVGPLSLLPLPPIPFQPILDVYQIWLKLFLYKIKLCKVNS
ncbi:hypothetical protein SDC9_195717 [bioreactor metagenome]|uniref:Oligopeptide transport ATP-binding protein OppD n=1 Tax=bioreactor metagenome TaxID=1076179 RepID=A0A645ILA8_9ZZZZ